MLTRPQWELARGLIFNICLRELALKQGSLVLVLLLARCMPELAGNMEAPCRLHANKTSLSDVLSKSLGKGK